MAIPISYNIRSIWVRRVTAVVTMLGVALVTAVLACSLMLSEGVKRAVQTGGREDVAVVMRKGSTAEMESNLEEAAVSLVTSQPGVAQANGKPVGSGEVVAVLALEKLGTDASMGPQLSNVVIRGYNDMSLGIRPNLKPIEGRLPAPGTEEAMVGRAVAGRFKGLSIGQTIEIRRNRPMRVVGIFSDAGSSAESEVWSGIDVVRSGFGRQGGVSVIRAQLTNPDALSAFKAAVEADKRLGLEVKRETTFLSDQSDGLSMFITVMGLIISIFFSVGAVIGATITMHAAVAHRTREVGTLRAIGFSRSAILLGFLAEAVTMTVCGGAVGVGLALALSGYKVSMVNMATWSELVFGLAPSVGTIGTAVVFSVVMGILGGFLPAVRASRISPLAAMRG